MDKVSLPLSLSPAENSVSQIVPKNIHGKKDTKVSYQKHVLCALFLNNTVQMGFNTFHHCAALNVHN